MEDVFSAERYAEVRDVHFVIIITFFGLSTLVVQVLLFPDVLRQKGLNNGIKKMGMLLPV